MVSLGPVFPSLRKYHDIYYLLNCHLEISIAAKLNHLELDKRRERPLPVGWSVSKSQVALSQQGEGHQHTGALQQWLPDIGRT